MTATRSHSPNVVFQPVVQKSIQRGIHQIVAPVRATLGPISRTVVMSSNFPGEAPEVMDKGSLIARRMISLPDRDADMGAMLVRSLLWRLHKTVGDSTATAAVLCQAIYDGGLHYLAAGGNPVRLRFYLEAGLQIILNELDSLTRAVSGTQELASFAQSVCGDATLAGILGEVLDTLGPYVHVDVRAGHSHQTTRQYVEGAYWKAGVQSLAFLPDGSRVELANPALLVTDLSLDEPGQAGAAIEAALLAGKKSLVVISSQVSEAVTAFLLANRDRTGFSTLAVKIPEPLLERPGTLADLNALVGGRVLLSAAGDAFSHLQSADLGSVELAWADKDYLGMVEGAGDEATRNRHIAALQSNLERSDDPERRARLLQRLGQFVGGSAIVWCGGATERQIKARKEQAQHAISALRAALDKGVIPGGGVGLLACQPALRRRLAQAESSDERAACRVLLDALEIPFRVIVSNAGHDPGTIIGALRGKLRCQGFDVRTGRVIDMQQAGLYDGAAACKAAVQGAVSTAAMALTIDVLVHTVKPEQVLDPG